MTDKLSYTGRQGGSMNPANWRPCDACGTLTPRPDPDHSVLCGDCWVLDQAETLPALAVRDLIVDTLLRNLGMVGTYTVPSSSATFLVRDDVEAMLRAAAANLAQVLDGRVRKVQQ